MMKLGVTGGIGSGKTSVCRVFMVLGISVFSADRVAGEIMERDGSIVQGINSIAGRDIYPEGKLNKAALAEIIFHDSRKLAEVNALVHPAVFSSFERWVPLQTSPYVIMEAAILFESGAADLVDKIVAVTAPEEERLGRVMGRSNLSREQVSDRIKNQMDDLERVSRSDFVIYNAENDMIIPSILDIHDTILKSLNI